MKANFYQLKNNTIRLCTIALALALSADSYMVTAQSRSAGAVSRKGIDVSTSSKMGALSEQHAPLSFIENKGQVKDQNRQSRPDIQFEVVAANGLNIFIGNGAIHYQFCKADSPHLQSGQNDVKASPLKQKSEMLYHGPHTMYRMDVELKGANKNAEVITENKLGYFENHVTANTGSQHDIAHAWQKITYKDIYPNIDWVLSVKNGQIEHEFVIREGGNASDIQLEYGGAKDLKINTDGSLTAKTPQGIITEQAPRSYQPDGAIVKSSFILTGDVLSYKTGNYTGQLIIDPTLAWGTYYCGSSTLGVGYESIFGMTTDRSGNIYVTGQASAFSDIATTGAYETSVPATGGNIAFLAKFNNAGTLLWGTYYGDSLTDGIAVATDASGNVFMTGATTDLVDIATTGAHQTTYGGDASPDYYNALGSAGGDAFLAKFDSSGSLLWGTYYGGSGDDGASGIATDASGNVYITGGTSSSSGIATFGPSFRGGASGGYDNSDAFIAKFSSTGSLLWGTYYGGYSDDFGCGVATDTLGNLYATGWTLSSSDIATSGAFQATYGGGSYYYDYGYIEGGDAYLLKLNASTGATDWCTYYGGSDFEYANSVATDGNANIYIAGWTGSTSGIASPGAYQTSYGGSTDGFLAKFTSSGSREWATYYGGPGYDLTNVVALDNYGNVYIDGNTQSTSGIATPGAFLTAYTYSEDGYWAYFNSAGVLQYGTYFGGNGATAPWAFAVDKNSGDVYLAGGTGSSTGIATAGAHQTALTGGVGGFNCFLAQFNCSTPTDSISGDTAVCIGSSITLNAYSNANSVGIWSASNGSAALSTTGVITGVSTGIDTITYIVATGCGIDTATHIVSVHYIAPVVAVSSNEPCHTTGVITTTVTGGASPYAYAWSNGATTADLDSLPGGTYDFSLTVTDSNGCTANSTYSVTVPAAITINSPFVNGTSCTESYGSIFLSSVSGGTPFPYYTGTGYYEFSWSNGSTSDYLTDLPVGVYVVIITDYNGCTDTAAYSINSGYVMSISGSGTNPSSCTGTDGSIDIGANGSTAPPYFYLWSNGLTGADISGLAAGNYSVTATDNAGCTAIEYYTLTGPDTIVVTGTTTPTSGCYSWEWDGSISLAVTGGATPYIYNWSNGANTQNLTGLAGGNYTVVVTDANGCSRSASFTVGQPDSTIITSLVTNASACTSNDGSIILTPESFLFAYDETVSWAFTYNWSNGATSEDIYGLSAGVYTVLLTDPYGCTATASYTVTQPNPDAIIIGATSSNPSTCGGSDGNIMLTVFGDASPFTYHWSNGATSSGLSGISAGNYSVTVTDANGCTSTGGNYTISPPDIISITGVTTNASYCGAGDGSITLSVGGSAAPFTYRWSDGSTAQNRTSLFAGSYSVVVTDANGCTNTASFVVTGPYVVTISGVPVNTSACAGNDGSITLAVSSTDGIGVFSYQWTDITTGTGISTSEDISSLSAGIYSVTVTDYYGCNNTALFTVNGPDTIKIADSITAESTCTSNDASIALTVTGNGASSGSIYPCTYSWSDGETTSTAYPLAPGNYSVTVTDVNGCTNTASYTVRQADLITLTGTESFSCYYYSGSISLAVNGTTAPDFYYSWSDGETVQNITNLYPGNYSVTVTDNNGCTDTASFVVGSPNITVSVVSADISTCGGSDGSISAAVSGGISPYTYEWIEETAFGSITLPSTTDSISGLLVAGYYLVYATDANGCSAGTEAYINQPDPISIGGTPTNPSACGGTDGSIALSVSGDIGPDSYAWSNGTTAEDPSGLAAGNYSVTLTDANGCFSTAYFTINQTDTITLSGTSAGVSPCYSDSNGSIALTVTGSGYSPYTYLWSNGATTQNLSGIIGGNYSVTVTDAHGCNNTATYNVYQPEAITFGASVTNVSVFGGSDGTISITYIAGAYEPFTFSWSNGYSGDEIDWELPDTGLTAGTYTLTLNDAHGCSGTAAYVVTQPADTSGNTPPVFNGGSPQTLTVCENSGAASINSLLAVSDTDAGQTETWSVLSSPVHGILSGFTATASSGSAAVTPSGLTYMPAAGYSGSDDFTIEVNDGAGGTATTVINVTISSLPTVGAGSGYAICTGASTILAGTGASSYTWSPGSSLSGTAGASVTANPTVTTTYTVTGTNPSGCTNTATVTVTVNSLPSIDAGSGSSICIGSSATLTATGGADYSWSPATALSATTGASITADPVTNTTYTVTGTNILGCTNTAEVTITVNSLPTIDAGSGSSICIGSSASLTATGGAVYSWSPATALSATTGASITADPAANTTYTVTGTNIVGCTNAAEVTITVNSLPIIDAGSGSSICIGSSATLTATGGVVYSWSPATALSATTGASITADPAANTTYTVTGTNILGCANTAEVTITVNSLPTIDAGSGSSICIGSSATLTATGGIVYSWSPATALSATTGASVTADPVTNTTYIVTGTNTLGCANTSDVTVIVDPLANSGVISGVDTVCETDSILLTETVTGGVWSTANGNAFITSGGFVHGITVGFDTVRYTVANTCDTAVSQKAIQIFDCTTRVKSISQASDVIDLYPNPTDNNITISSSGKINRVIITDLLGQNVFSEVYNANEVVIGLNQLANGLYIVKVNDAKVYKVIKQ